MTPLRRALLVAAVGGAAAASGYMVQLWRIGGLGSTAEAGITESLFASRYAGLDGTTQTLAPFRGRVLVVNYWATWCAPCREEIPLFVELQQEYAAKNVQFVGIAVDQLDKVREFAREYKVNYPLYIAGLDAVELSRRAGNTAGVLPYTLVLDGRGQIAASLVGGISEARMRGTLEPLI